MFHQGLTLSASAHSMPKIGLDPGETRWNEVWCVAWVRNALRTIKVDGSTLQQPSRNKR